MKDNKRDGSIIFVRSRYLLIRINLDDIEYIESVENYIKIHLVGGKVIMTLMPLKKILEKIPKEKFIRIHRKYIISIDKIVNIGRKKVRLSSVELPSSDRCFKNLKKLILNNEQEQM